MDVLQLLKMEFKERLAELTALTEQAETSLGVAATLARLRAHLSLEAAYLLPELSTLYTKNDVSLARLEGEVQDLQDLLEGLDSQEIAQSSLEEVKAAFVVHFQSLEDKILPVMRQKITTAEREELFFVLQDAKHELMKGASALPVM